MGQQLNKITRLTPAGLASVLSLRAANLSSSVIVKTYSNQLFAGIKLGPSKWPSSSMNGSQPADNHQERKPQIVAFLGKFNEPRRVSSCSTLVTRIWANFWP